MEKVTVPAVKEQAGEADGDNSNLMVMVRGGDYGIPGEGQKPRSRVLTLS